MPGLARRRLYKPERRPGRKKGVLHNQAPVGCPDATDKEIAMALYSLCRAGNLEIGQGLGYDPIRDEYHAIGKVEGKAQDMKIEGVAVAALINELRAWNGVAQFDKQALTKVLG